MAARPANRPSLLVDGLIYSGWTELRVTRSLERAAADFDIALTERWMGLDEPWRLVPFTPVELLIDDDTLITGYIDAIAPSLSFGNHAVRIAGRSKTADLVDCTPILRGTEFRRSTLPAIARALASPFGVDVVEDADAGAPFALEAFDRGDTAWDTIERLARMRGVLATDDERGRLVLTRAASGRSSGRLVQGENVEDASAELDGSKRFSHYHVLMQQPSAAALDPDAEAPGEQPFGRDQPAIEASAADPEVPRYRPRIIRAEGDGGQEDARRRALWAAAVGRGRGMRAAVTVPGWRQPDGRLWKVNELVDVFIPFLQLDHEMVIVEATFTLAMKEGRRTRLVVTLPEALTPEPIAERRAGNSLIWGPRGTFAGERGGQGAAASGSE